MARKSLKKNNIDNDTLMEEEFPIIVTIMLTLLFIFIGIALGYLLYKLAMNNSAIIINKYLF